MKKRKIIIVLMLAIIGFTAIVFSRNNDFYFDFSKFLLTDKKEKEVRLKSLNLKEDIINSNDISEIKNNIKEVFEILANEEYYDNNSNDINYFNGVREYLNDSFYGQIMSGNTKSYLKNSIDNIYSTEYTEFKESKVFKVEQALDSINCYVEVVSVNDDKLFNREVIKLSLDSNFKIINDAQISNISSVTNTTKELGVDSLLQKNHNEFIKSLNELFAKLKNSKLYNELQSEESSQQSKFTFDILIDNIDIKNKNNDSLKQLFMAGKGDFSQYAISSYTIDDIKGMATTTYTIKFYVNGNIETYEFEYSRILDSITKVTKRI